MLLSYKWMDGWVWMGSLCGATIRASLCDANKCGLTSPRFFMSFLFYNIGLLWNGG